MIGTNEMSSTSMDISESFRPEDLAKTDFFDFVTASDMGIGIGVGVGVSMVGLHHPHLHQHHNHQNNNSVNERITVTSRHDSTSGAITNDSVASPNVINTNTQINSKNNNNNNETGNANNNNNSKNSNNINNVISNSSSSNNNNSNTHNSSNNSNSSNSTSNSNNSSNNNNNDPTLQGYEFWHADKEQNRLESTIFEDLDRYCWQQQQHQTTITQQAATPTTTTTVTHDTHNGNTTTSSVNTSASSTTGSISHPSSASSVDNTDGQIYTLTVLNGSESWLKREPDSQIGGTLDLDSLLGTFPGYIKSEYPYDESGFSSDNNKTTNRVDPNGLEIPQVLSQRSISPNVMSSQSLPPLISALSVPGGVHASTDICNSNSMHVNPQLALFQNNNNDWQMTDHNAEQNSAESLLRSALQGKGYSKGLPIQNGLTLLPSSPSVKDDEMRRILFSTEADALGFGDSSLNTTQIFDDAQNPSHNAHIGNSVAATNANNMMVDDMFLSLENVFNDDFEKIKRIANEVQQYCNAPTDYANTSNDVMMQIAAPQTTSTAVPARNTCNVTHQIPVQMQQQQAFPTSTTPSMNLQARSQQQQQLKSESVVSTSTAVTPSVNRLITPKINKKYKRSSSITATNNNNHNNNNPNVINNNNTSLNGSTSTLKTPGGNISSCGSNSSNSSNSPTQCNGQRKERSLHYCSICAKGFKDKYSVNVHIRTHTGEKPFACSLCGKSFRQKAHLAKHYQTHMAQKNNGNLVKTTNAKNARHHNTVTANSTTSITTTPTSRNLTNSSTVSSSNLNAVTAPLTVNSRNSSSIDVLSVGVSGLNGTMNTSRNVLPPANGLLANI